MMLLSLAVPLLPSATGNFHIRQSGLISHKNVSLSVVGSGVYFAVVSPDQASLDENINKNQRQRFRDAGQSSAFFLVLCYKQVGTCFAGPAS